MATSLELSWGGYHARRLAGVGMHAPSSEGNTSGSAELWSILERVLRPKFRFASGAVEQKEEAEYREAVAQAFSIVQRKLDDPNAAPIDDLEAYAATVAYNVFKGFLKRKYPERHKLAVEIKTTLDVDPRLAYWLVQRTSVGGRSAWKGQPARLEANGKLALENPARATKECFGARSPNSLLPSDMLLALYDWLRHPFGYDPTVNFCFLALGLREVEVGPVSDNGPEPADPKRRPEESAEAGALARFVWQQILSLDPVRRGAFLLFEPPGENQEAICDQLLVHGVCTLRDLAEAVGLSFEQLAEFRQRERATYDAVGELYSMPPKQVENIRRGVTDLLWRRLGASGFREEGRR